MGIDWSRIEQDYVMGTCTYVELAEKYGVHKSTIAAHGSEGNWTEKRDTYREQTTNKSLTKSQEKISEQMSEAVVDSAKISADTIRRLHGKILDPELEPNSLEGVANALDRALRTHKRLVDDGQKRQVRNGPSEEVRKRSMRALINRILSERDVD
ncbi:MAG: hypothetical protein ACLFWB_12545 [Armatimonadota bacterium]